MCSAGDEVLYDLCEARGVDSSHDQHEGGLAQVSALDAEVDARVACSIE